MKLVKINQLNPKNLIVSPTRLFRSKKDRSSVSRSDPFSFGSGTSSTSSSDASTSHQKPGSGAGITNLGTPKSVLPEILGNWSDSSADMNVELAQAFRLTDRDDDGLVSRKELQALLSRIGAEPLSEEEVKMMLSEVDRDGDGHISLETLLSRFGSACGPACDSELRETFDIFDADHDGRITAEELWGFFTAMGDEQCTLEDCRRMIAGVDKNGDGFVCFEDFSLMMELQR
ncbi:probable calcium-binding protein CML36 [Juglans microcarpa x Juglans regia]|uniref:probable calcium-binding protein CML36 n=1 Tax=Juglans microcarpa x Juglans regia TaxID=2249226 RepID=UPI001B7F5DA7|nr:probable calcium-binding protein CML36 [Juglans microcarpa x Juglans regia]